MRLFKRRSFSHLRVVIFPALNYTECYPKQIQKWVDCPRGKQRITRLDKEVNTSEVASLAEWDWAGMRDETCKALGNPQPGRPPLAPDYLPSVQSAVSGQLLCEMGSPLYASLSTHSWSLFPRPAVSSSSSTEAPLSLVHPCRQSMLPSYSRTVVTPDSLEHAPSLSTISVDSPTQPMSSESPQESASVPITVHQVAAKSERRQERWVGRFYTSSFTVESIGLQQSKHICLLVR